MQDAENIEQLALLRPPSTPTESVAGAADLQDGSWNLGKPPLPVLRVKSDAISWRRRVQDGDSDDEGNAMIHPLVGSSRKRGSLPPPHHSYGLSATLPGHPMSLPDSKPRWRGLQAQERAMHRLCGTVPSQQLVRRPNGRRWRAGAPDYDEQVALTHIFKPPLSPTHSEKRRVACYCTCEQLALFALLKWLERAAKDSRRVESAAVPESSDAPEVVAAAPVVATPWFGLAGWRNKMYMGVLHSSFSPTNSPRHLTDGDALDNAPASPRSLILEHKHAFYFASGCCVFWGLTPEEEARHLLAVAPFSTGEVARVETHSMEFSYADSIDQGDVRSVSEDNAGDDTTISKDAITLNSTDIAEKLALSFGLAQSALLDVFEARVEALIRSTRQLPSSLASVGSMRVSQRDTAKLIGQLFLELADVNLHSNLLDAPAHFREEKAFEPLYERMLRHQDVGGRLELLNKRMGVLRDLVSVLHRQLKRHSGATLEWIVIWMLVAQLVIAVGWEIVLKDVLGYFRW